MTPTPLSLSPALEACARGDWPAAKALALAYVQQHPRSPEGFLALATACYGTGALDQALLALGQALPLDANASNGYFLLGVVLDDLGQPGYAERAFATALRLDPEHPTAMQRRLACRNRQAASPLADGEAQAIERLLEAVRPTVSACLIVKNEEQTLARCLESLKGWVDEIVVVDTGSTDRTVAVAESFGATIGHFTWVDDFSAARNHSLSFATSEWILIIDADESLEVDDPDTWHACLRRRAVPCYTLYVSNVRDDGSIDNDAPVLRLFQRHDAIRFSGRLHETVGPSLDALGLAVADVGIFARLRHTGYQSDALAAHDKGQRNLALAQLAVEENPDDFYALYHLMRSYCFAQQPEPALGLVARLSAMPELDKLSLALWGEYVSVHFELLMWTSRLAEGVALLDRALEKLPEFPEFLFNRGRVRWSLGRAAEARADFERCLAMAGRTFPLSMRRGLTDELPRQALAAIDELTRAVRPTVSAVLIVKNEEATLARCLASLAGYVDEIVVVDTGSTDGTVAVAGWFGATIGHFTWVDDFSAARNHALSLAKSDWVLVIDADETLAPLPASQWSLVLNGPVDGVIVTQTNITPTGDVESETAALRLFKRHPGIWFAGRLHETVASSIQAAGLRVGEAAFLRLLHTGYQAARVEATDKGERNARLAAIAVEDQPVSAEAWLDLARSHALAQAPEAALAAFEHLMALEGGLEALDDRRWIYAVQSLQAVYRELGRDADAEALLDSALDRLMGYPEFHFERGTLRAKRGDRDGARADFEACLAARGRTFPAPVRPGLTDALPQAALDALGRPSVSAVLIVKNEEKSLARCLESVQGWVDEIVVVDTGSTDGTVAVAESFGATIGHFTWVDDFSAARNHALSLATSEWVLVIDADETLVVDDPAVWREGLDARDRGYLLEIVNVDAGGRVESRTGSFPRLFRRHPEARFSGRLHESAAGALADLGQSLTLVRCAHLRHAGYTDAAIAQGEKFQRNSRLAERMIADDPTDPDGWHHLANTHWLAKDAPGTLRALEGLKRAEEAGRPLSPNYKRTALLVEAWALIAGERWTEALAVLDAGLAHTPGWVEYHHERGRVRARLGDVAGAIADFEACLDTVRGTSAAREGLTGYATHVELVALHLDAGRPERAVAHLRAAAADPACPPDEAARMAALAAQLTPPAPAIAPQAIAQMEAVVAPADRLEAAIVALAAGEWSAAKAHALSHLEAQPRDAEAFLCLAMACHRLGDADLALVALSQALHLDANASAGYFLLGVVLDDLDQPGYAERAFATALRLAPEHPTAMQRRLAVRNRQPAHPLPDAQAQAVERLLDAVRPTVSACLIVKNEEQTLERCLESLKGWVDEIVVVDTGSTDGTVAIAESFGAKIGHFTWVDDFSAARNHALSLATSEWVLVIDADETLVVEDAEAWMSSLRRRAFGGYIVSQRNAQPNGEWLDNPLMRLFQRHPGIFYRGRLHEDVTRAIAELGWAVTDVPGLRLDHDGYLPERAAEKDKWARNFRLALAEVESQSDNVAAWYNLGRSAMNMGQREATLTAFARVAGLLTEGAELGEPRHCTFVSLYQRLLAEDGRADEAIALLDAGLALVPGFPEFHYERGMRRAEQGMRVEARADFEACLAPARRPYLAAVREGITDALPRRAIAELDAAVPLA